MCARHLKYKHAKCSKEMSDVFLFFGAAFRYYPNYKTLQSSNRKSGFLL